MYSIFNDFKLKEKVSNETIEKYKNKVPEQLLEIWQNYGFGSFLNGYLKIVNPEEYEELLKETYIPVEDEPIEFNTVLFATAMGELIVWEYVNEEISSIILVSYRRGCSSMVLASFRNFFRVLNEEAFKKRKLKWDLYLEAREKYGEPEYDECFGYVPLLGLGGKDTIANLEKVKLKEHIYIINDLVGPVEEME